MARLPSLALLAVVVAAPARADRGAISVEAGGGMTAISVPAPFALTPKALTSLSGTVTVGARYALSNSLELVAGAFYEPPVTLWHNEVTVETLNGQFPGTLTHQLSRYGGQAGAHLVFGMVWRFHLGLELGWSHRAYSGFQHVDDSGAEPFDYKLGLPDFSTDNLVVSPVLGLEWAAGDHWSLAVMPRLQALLGPDPTFSLLVPVTFCWSWYL